MSSNGSLEPTCPVGSHSLKTEVDPLSGSPSGPSLLHHIWNHVLSKHHSFLYNNCQEPSADRLAMNMIYLRAAGLHLRLSAFFDSSNSSHYWEDLLGLWSATTAYLEQALSISTSAGSVLSYVSNYILQMIIAAGFTLMKLLNSFFANHIDLEYGKSLFNRTIWAIRDISVTPNDLPSRLAEVLAQLWRGGGAGSRAGVNGDGTVDSSLQLKVRCRMSVSHVFDAVWRWREDYQAKGRGNLECTSFPSQL